MQVNYCSLSEVFLQSGDLFIAILLLYHLGYLLNLHVRVGLQGLSYHSYDPLLCIYKSEYRCKVIHVF